MLTYRLLILSGAISIMGCNAGHDPSPISPNTDQPAQQASRPVDLTITLVQVTQRPTPTGLPTRFQISSTTMAAGQKTAITWRALDGDTQRQPRTGVGTLEMADARTISLVLRGADRSDSPSIELSGTVDGIQLRGSFSDKLFYARAGSFIGDVQQK